MIENVFNVAIHMDDASEVYLTEFESDDQLNVSVSLLPGNFKVFLQDSASAQALADLFSDAARRLEKAEEES